MERVISALPFSRNTKKVILQDYDTVSIDGNFFSSSKDQLTKLFLSLGFPYRFVRDFFYISKEHAKDFFSSVLNGNLNNIFVNNCFKSFIYLSNEWVLKNYLHTLDVLHNIEADKVFFSKEDSFLGSDSFLFIKGDKIVAITINLVEEKISIFQGQTCHNKLYLFFDYTLYLNSPSYVDYFIIPSFSEIEALSLFADIEKVTLCGSELVKFLKNAKVLKGRKHLKVENPDFYFRYFHNHFDSSILSDMLSDPTTPTPYRVQDILEFSHELLFENEETTLQDIYITQDSLLKRELKFIWGVEGN